jgi:hypothetical protein
MRRTGAVALTLVVVRNAIDQNQRRMKLNYTLIAFCLYISSCGIGFNSRNCFIDNRTDKRVDSVKFYLNQKWVEVGAVDPKAIGKEDVQVDYLQLKDYTACAGTIYIQGRRIAIPTWFLGHGGNYEEVHIKLDSDYVASIWLE